MAIPSSGEFPEVDPRLMPREVACTLPDDLKRLYFSRLVIGHPRMTAILKKLLKMTQPESGFDIVLAIGPTGVGKTELLKEMVRQVRNDFREEMLINTGLIPVVGIEVPEPGQKQFAWSALYTALLEQLNDRLIHKKIETTVQDEIATIKPWSTRHANVTALQMALKNGLAVRGTRLVIVDEAPHLLGHLAGRDLLNLANAFKSLSNVGRTTLVLAGSYDLLQLMSLSGQLSRRICVVHFDRYRLKNGDSEQFGNSLDQMQSFLPTAELPDLLPYAESMQEACIGCVGIAKQTMQRALVNALRDQGKWSTEHFQEALLSTGALKKIREEILKGESEIREFTSADLLVPKGSRHSGGIRSIPKKLIKDSPPRVMRVEPT